jgi:hypothetical protein
MNLFIIQFSTVRVLLVCFFKTNTLFDIWFWNILNQRSFTRMTDEVLRPNRPYAQGYVANYISFNGGLG